MTIAIVLLCLVCVGYLGHRAVVLEKEIAILDTKLQHTKDQVSGLVQYISETNEVVN